MVMLYHVNLKGERKHVLLVKSKKHITEWSASTTTIWEDFTSMLFTLKSSDFTEESVHLKIPQFEAISGTSYYQQLKDVIPIPIVNSYYLACKSTL